MKVLVLSVLLLLLTVVSRAQAPLPAGPLVAYAMENGTDASGNNRNATLTATTPVPGKYNNALAFNGSSSRMTVPTLPAFTNAFTLEAWVFLRASGPTGPALFTTPYGWQAVVYQNLDVMYLAEAGGFVSAGFVSSTTKSLIQIMGPTKVQEQTWRHVAAVYNGSSLTLYVDAVQFATTPASGNLTTSTSPVEIGGSQKDGGYLNGTIDDVRIYNRALTAAEITADMNTPVDAKPELVAGWDLEVWARGANVTVNVPVATASFEKSAAICNLAPTTPPTATVINPTTARLADPVTAGRECEIAAQTFFTGVPLGSGYFTTAKARGTNGTISNRGMTSNNFDRVAVIVPPPVPGAPVVLPK